VTIVILIKVVDKCKNSRRFEWEWGFRGLVRLGF